VPTVKLENQSTPAHREYAGGFVTKLAHKDLNLAVEAAKASGAPLLLGNLTESIYRPLAADEIWGKRDFSAVYKYLDENAS
jgi:3-hydroxyisobutyrate dehydrogenase